MDPKAEGSIKRFNGCFFTDYDTTGNEISNLGGNVLGFYHMRSELGKHAFSNMMIRGLQQSNHLIIDDCGIT